MLFLAFTFSFLNLVFTPRAIRYNNFRKGVIIWII
nr:MAG TPA: hypothetical protein [Caudoviricetes sp.]